MATWVDDGVPSVTAIAQRGESVGLSTRDEGALQIAQLRGEGRRPTCPGCSRPVDFSVVPFRDGKGRRWHLDCVTSTLAKGYRDPLSEEEQTAPVEFDVEGQVFALPHHTRVDAIYLYPGVEFVNLFVGNQRAVGSHDFQATFRGRDFPGGKIPVGCHAATGLHLTLDARTEGGASDPHPRWKILGQRLPDLKGSDGPSPLVVGVRTDVAPGGIAQTFFSPHAIFRGTHIACDDWEGWCAKVVGVGNPNTCLDLGHLAGPLTPAETCQFQVGEQVAVMVKNLLADHPRTFVARLYGEYLFETVPASAGNYLSAEDIQALAEMK